MPEQEKNDQLRPLKDPDFWEPLSSGKGRKPERQNRDEETKKRYANRDPRRRSKRDSL